MTIPASEIVNVLPNVLGTGGNPLSMNGVLLSQSTYLPTNAVQTFSSPDAVSAFFGPASTEYALSKVYFLGFDGSTIKPTTLIFSPYVAANRAAWLQSGSFVGVGLSTIQGYSGSLTITVDGVAKTAASINLATATSFSNAASLIQAGFTTPNFTVSYDSVKSVFVFTSNAPGASSTATYCTGTLATNLKLTSATAALLSQGAVADTPATAMDMLKNKTQNWAAATTIWEPSLSDKTLFAVWSNAQNQRYLYVSWDADDQAIVNGSTTNFGYVCKNAEYNGVAVVYNTKELAAFVLGMIASIDFSRRNGRITAAFKSQSGLAQTVTDQQIASNLLANNYSFYGPYATANDQFTFFYDGQISGDWKFIDPFVNEIWLNSQLQLANMSLLTSVNSVPYNEEGYSLIRAACQDPIDQALNCGVIRTGVSLSTQQKAILNQAAGRDISTILEQQGYYLQILDPGAQARGNRQSPVINFWYTDGSSVHKITIASTAVL